MKKNDTINYDDLKKFKSEVEIATRYNCNGDIKKIVAIIDFSIDTIIYRVGNSEKTRIKATLRDAVETFNQM